MDAGRNRDYSPMTIRSASLFSGIGAPELAMPHWSWLWHAEIEPFPSAVMAHHHPASINLGDVLAADFLERVQAKPVDVLVGGPPCQAFSVAGLRGGLADPRGNLSLRWVQIIHATRPRYALTENVPGWLNSSDNAFGCFLGALVGADDALAAPPGGSWPSAGMVAGPLQRACWRVLDAQYFGLAQRRQRVFVVSCPADGGDPSQVLFERQGVRGDSAPSRETGAGSTTGALAGTSPGGGWRLGADEAAAGQLVAIQGSGKRSGASQSSSKAGDGFGRAGDPMFTLGTDSRHAVAGPLTSCGGTERKHGFGWGQQEWESEYAVPVAHALRAEGFDASEDGPGRGTPIVPCAIRTSQTGANGHGFADDVAHALDQSISQDVAYRTSGNCGAWSTGEMVDTLSTGTDPSSPLVQEVAYACQGTNVGEFGTLRSGNGHLTGGQPFIAQPMSVRRLTPTECERLQGFPDDFTAIRYRGKPAKDGPRYRALGNSMAVPVVRWILSRIEQQPERRQS